MQVIPNIKPSPRLLSSVGAEVRNGGDPARQDSRHKLKRSSSLGNGRAIFLGLLLGALAVSAVGYFWHSPESADHHMASVRRFLAVRTQKVSTPLAPSEKPSTLTVQIHPSMIRVTAIALGHPRLAIINGKEVTEGDAITLKTRDNRTSVTLHIVRIVEGRIELTDGTHVITAPLATPSTGGVARSP